MSEKLEQVVTCYDQTKVALTNGQRVVVSGQFRFSRRHEVGQDEHPITEVVTLPDCPLNADVGIDSGNSDRVDRELLEDLAELVVGEGTIPMLGEDAIGRGGGYEEFRSRTVGRTDHRSSVPKEALLLHLRQMDGIINETKEGNHRQCFTYCRQETLYAVSRRPSWRHIAPQSSERAIIAAEVPLKIDDRERGAL
jgi:hypothetical protein